MIKYHGTPIGGNGVEIASFLSGRHALVSFANQQDIAVVAHLCNSFVLDNGAFSFWSSGATPDWDKYLSWVLEWYQHPAFDWWLIPDVIDGTEEDNRRLVQEYGNALPHAVPVYHLHESLDYLDMLLSTFPRVALGSSGEWATPNTKGWWARMTEIFKVACGPDGKPRARLHGLRMLNPKIFTKLPLASADSCNAGRNNGDTDRWEGPYKPMRPSQRAAVIGDRIEYFNSAPAWGAEWK